MPPSELSVQMQRQKRCGEDSIGMRMTWQKRSTDSLDVEKLRRILQKGAREFVTLVQESQEGAIWTACVVGNALDQLEGVVQRCRPEWRRPWNATGFSQRFFAVLCKADITFSVRYCMSHSMATTGTIPTTLEIVRLSPTMP